MATQQHNQEDDGEKERQLQQQQRCKVSIKLLLISNVANNLYR